MRVSINISQLAWAWSLQLYFDTSRHVRIAFLYYSVSDRGRVLKLSHIISIRASLRDHACTQLISGKVSAFYSPALKTCVMTTTSMSLGVPCRMPQDLTASQNSGKMRGLPFRGEAGIVGAL
jgi:hypothetical protein